MGMRRLRHAATLALAALLLAAIPISSRAGDPPPNPDRVPAPEFPPGLKWLNSEPLRLSGLRGKVVLVDFWEYTCVNCIRTFPYLKSWHQKYRDKGLVIVGVHSPEFEFARKAPNVARAARDFGL